ncbi:E3 ubiquitin-protein ligase RNF138-like [Zalophus californianus]|uniref:E3 ubiquitin-protein ligase RNF138 n=1 Tax=Zalophus californianus TaxID=9704 RepID=A0A6J2DTH5_ZALCA|nr:E3 ubiquitin-protein ligase RNF138-like [Zalophus californianus]
MALSKSPLTSPTTAEELSAATSYTEDDFHCPVCQEVLKTPVRTAACQHVFWNSNRSETSTSDTTETYQENTSSSGHPTFKCPLCQESNFTRQRLLDHCNSNHLFQIVPVNLQLDEETQYQTAVEESFQVNI